MRNIVAGILVVFFVPVGVPAFGQTAEPAPVEMRQDEAFWNAIRDSQDPEAFKLFIQSHPNSPYIAEANAKIEQMAQPPAVEAAPSADNITPTDQASVTPAPAQIDPNAVPNVDEVIAALDKLGISTDLMPGETPDPRMIESYIDGYRFHAEDRNSGDDVTDDELREIIYFAENRDAIYLGGAYDRYILNPLRHRLISVYKAAYGTSVPSSMPELVTALQRHLGLPKTGLLDQFFIAQVSSEPVTFPPEQASDFNQIIGDWVFQDSPSFRSLPRRCFLLPRSDSIRWEGPMLTAYAPAAPRYIYSEGSGSDMTFWLAPNDVFSASDPVTMVDGTKELPLFQAVDAFGDAGHWNEKLNENGTSPGTSFKMLRRAAGEVRIEGMSKFGLPLTLFFSAKGFTRAFSTMSKTCSGGKLDVWLD